MQIIQQLCGSLWPGKEIAYHQHGPPVTNQLQRACYRAAIDLASTQKSETSYLILLHKNTRTCRFLTTFFFFWDLLTGKIELDVPKIQATRRVGLRVAAWRARRNFCWYRTLLAS